MDTGYNLINEWYVMSHKTNPAGQSSNLHCHSSYEMFVMVHGSTNILVNDRLIELSGGEILLLKPDDLHKNNGGTKHERYAVHFTDKYILNYYTEETAQMLTSIFDNQKRTLKPETFSQILKFLREMETNERTAFIHIGEILTMLSDRKNHVKSEKSAHFQPVNKILVFINKNYGTINTLDDIAESAHISKQYLCTVFKQETGVTVTEYLNSVRTNNACELLQNTRMSITDIASSCGYNSTMYFCKVFKNLVHMTPNEYRKYIKSI